MSSIFKQSDDIFPAAGPSSPSKVSTASSQYDEYDPDELHWFGAVDTPETHARVLEPAQVERAEAPAHAEEDEVWDCATDILYCHGDHEDAGLSYEVQATSSQKKFRHDNDTHHIFPSGQPNYRLSPLKESNLLVQREPYDATTWDSPTDILYCHATEDIEVGVEDVPVLSALGIIDIPSLPPVPALIPSLPRKNRYGAIREPYNAATWDSPTDIIYAHGMLDEEDSDEDQVTTPKAYAKGIAMTPIEGAKGEIEEEDFYPRAAERLKNLQLV